MSEGIFAIYKPKGPTSHDIIDELRKITGVKKIGHAGTLDPLAEGILVVAIGKKYTKKLHALIKEDKEYEAVIKLGEESSTDDKEGIKKPFKVEKEPSRDEIKVILSDFEGEIEQVPPAFSAVKIGGKRAYALARKGNIVDLKPRKVKIKRIKLLSYNYPYLKIEVIVGSGTYIRSLARDVGKALGIGGYLEELKRTKVGKFNIKNSLTLSQFKKISSSQ